jgi:predicted nucleic acid-binding protein
MADTIIVDTNVPMDIARGNQRVADALQRYLKAGTPVYISKAAYEELVTRAKTPQLGGQYRELLSDLRVTVADKGAMADRINLIADNIELKPAPGAPGQIREYDRKNDPTKPGDAFVAAQAKAINAKLWTLDTDFAKRAPQFGVQLAPECSIPGISGIENVDNARQMMGLNPKPIGSNGLPLPPKGGSGGGSGGGGGGGAAGSYSLEGVADNTVPEVGGPSPKGEAIIGGIQIALEGLNFVLNLINDYVQKNKVNAALEPIKADVARARANNPRMGVAIIFYYTQSEAPEESIIKPGADFQYLIWGVGATSDEAREAALAPGSISRGTGPFERRISQLVWIPPLQPGSITSARCPFPPVAVGRFYLRKSTRAMFQGVSFDVLGGFDDTVETWVNLPEHENAEFAVLNPPTQVYWYNLNGRQAVDVPLKDAKTVNDNTIKVVDLDPWSPFHAQAAMVFPVDDWCEKVFGATNGTVNGALLGTYINFGMIRWIRPEYIHLLRFL